MSHPAFLLIQHRSECQGDQINHKTFSCHILFLPRYHSNNSRQFGLDFLPPIVINVTVQSISCVLGASFLILITFTDIGEYICEFFFTYVFHLIVHV